MCTRFVYNGSDTIVGFNFDIDPADYEHRVIAEHDRFFIGIRMPDGKFHSFHGVHANGNVGTLLYVHGNDRAAEDTGKNCCTVQELTEDFVRGRLSLDDVQRIAREKKIVYQANVSMQTMLSDRTGRVLIVEPGIGFRTERNRYSLITNYSLLEPESSRPYITPGDDRYERAKSMLEGYGEDFSVQDAFSVLREVRQEGLWATRVSFVYSVGQRRVYYVLNNRFDDVKEWALPQQGGGVR